MKRPELIIFGVFVVFAIGMVVWAVNREGGEEASPAAVSPALEDGKDLFVTNCGSCHTLSKAGTDGVVGPDLDEVLAPPGPPGDPAQIKERVLSAVEDGVRGRMPADIVSGPQAEEVAEFVAQVAGE